MSDKEEEENKKLTTRGLPEHEKDAVRREQNRQCVQRFRGKRREEYRQLCEAHLESTTQIKEIEKRIAALVKVLEDAGVQVPPNTADLVRASLAAAFVAVRLDDDEEEENNDNSAPDNEQLFNEIMQILDETEDDDQQAGPSS